MTEPPTLALGQSQPWRGAAPSSAAFRSGMGPGSQLPTAHVSDMSKVPVAPRVSSANLLSELDVRLDIVHGSLPDKSRDLSVRAARAGRYMGGEAPYGYDLEHVEAHPNPARASRNELIGQLVLIPDEADIVRFLFDSVGRGRGQSDLVDFLDQHQVPPPSGQDHSGWNVQCVSTILRNPRYTGYEFWRPFHSRDRTLRDPKLETIRVRSDNPAHPAIVTVEQFLTVDDILRVHSRLSRTSTSHAILHNRLFCGLCGRKMALKGRGQYRCRPTTVGRGSARPNGHLESISIAEPRLLGAIVPWLTENGALEAGVPSRAEVERAITQLNLRVEYDRDSATLHVKTGQATTLLPLAI